MSREQESKVKIDNSKFKLHAKLTSENHSRQMEIISHIVVKQNKVYTCTKGVNCKLQCIKPSDKNPLKQIENITNLDDKEENRGVLKLDTHSDLKTKRQEICEKLQASSTFKQEPQGDVKEWRRVLKKLQHDLLKNKNSEFADDTSGNLKKLMLPYYNSLAIVNAKIDHIKMIGACEPDNRKAWKGIYEVLKARAASEIDKIPDSTKFEEAIQMKSCRDD